MEVCKYTYKIPYAIRGKENVYFVTKQCLNEGCYFALSFWECAFQPLDL